jgi:hypothetical protein
MGHDLLRTERRSCVSPSTFVTYCGVHSAKSAEIQAAVQKHHHGVISMVLAPEAEEYRKTLALLTEGDSIT